MSIITILNIIQSDPKLHNVHILAKFQLPLYMFYF